MSARAHISTSLEIDSWYILRMHTWTGTTQSLLSGQTIAVFFLKRDGLENRGYEAMYTLSETQIRGHTSWS